MKKIKFFMQNAKKQPKDFRLQIFDILIKTLKACRLFLCQKIVKKLKEKKDNIKIETFEQDLKNAKKINTQDFKILAIYLMIYKFHLDLEKEHIVFERILKDYKLKTEQFHLIFQEKSDIKIDQYEILISFIKKIEKMKKFKENAEIILTKQNKIRKKIYKTKLSRKKLAEKHKNPRKTISKQFSPEKAIEKKPKKIFNKNPKENIRTDSKTDINKPIKFSDDSITNQPKKTDKFLTKDFQDIHPSWKFRLEQKNEQRNVQFQGTRKKLI